MRSFFGIALFCALTAACRGTVPSLSARSSEAPIGAVIIGGRIVLPSGGTRSGAMAINLEGEGGRQSHVYRLPVDPVEPVLYQVEPGTYHLTPTRSIWGTHQPRLSVRVEDARYRLPFPRDILRKAAIQVKAGRVVSLGVLEVRVTAALPGREPDVRIRLDDSLEARRQIVERMVKVMMDPAASMDSRNRSISWARPLERALLELAAEIEKPALFKAAPAATP